MILDALKFGYGAVRDIMGRKDARSAESRANKREDTKIRRTVKDARAAGIHPLAAMGSNIVGGHGSSGMVYSGNAGGEALNSVSRSDPLQQENARLQNESLKADIERTRADTARIIASAATSRSAIARATEGTRTTDPSSAILGADRSWPDAESYQQRYGELAEHLFGPQILAADTWQAIKRTAPTRRGLSRGRYGGSQWTTGN